MGANHNACRARCDVAARGAVAVRAYPPQWGMGPHDPALAELAEACGERGLPLVLTTRFEDVRQRHWLDGAGDLPGATIRAVVRASPRVRVLVTAAGRALIEEVHWGLTPEERARVWWDISWIWGPPDDDLAHLLRTVGPRRFVYGSGWPYEDLADAPIPGLPGAGLGNCDNSAAEVFAYLAFPAAGYYRFGVNSDDGFGVKVGTPGQVVWFVDFGQAAKLLTQAAAGQGVDPQQVTAQIQLLGINGLKAAGVKQDMGFITSQIGMFSYSGLSKDQMVRLRNEFGVYGTDTGRMCVAALNSKNIDYVCQAIAKVV